MDEVYLTFRSTLGHLKTDEKIKSNRGRFAQSLSAGVWGEVGRKIIDRSEAPSMPGDSVWFSLIRSHPQSTKESLRGLKRNRT